MTMPKIEPIGQDDEERFEGDTLVIPFVVPDQDDPNRDRLPLGDAEITWELRESKYDDPKLTDSDPEVQVDKTDAANGEFEVKIEKGATDSFAGDNVQVVVIEDGVGDQSTAVGKITLTGVKR